MAMSVSDRRLPRRERARLVQARSGGVSVGAESGGALQGRRFTEQGGLRLPASMIGARIGADV